MTLNKQYLLNNLWHGENSRERNRAEHFAGLDFEHRAALVALSMPDQSRIWGPDVSYWNLPPVDLKRMVELFGASFAIFKGCDGSVNSKYYFEHVAEAKRAGIPWGMYVWLYPGGKVSIDAQVNAWAARYNIDPPPMGIFIDAETTYYGGVLANPNANDLRAAHDKIKAKTGKAATTYTAKYFADTYLKGFDWTREELWVANYGVNNPLLPNGAPGYTIHQFTSTLDGKVLDPNGNAELDGNYYHDANLFRQRFGSTTPTDPEGEIMGYKCIKAVNVRNASNVVVAAMKVGDRIWGTAGLLNGLQRVTFNKIYRATGTVDTWTNCNVAINDGSVVFLQTISDTEPGTTTPDPVTLPAYFTAHDASGNELGKYNLEA